ncbi:MAG: EamA family transporter RarD [Solirubrobacteraceae bacterium]|nr:EamA family transporter RarD [Solirubrobacteraceae bacterium]
MGQPSTVRTGVLYGVAAYALWGVFPLYFHLLERSDAAEVVFHRVVWSLLFCLVLVAALRQREALGAVLADRAIVATLGLAAVLLATNWGVYVHAVTSGQVIEASLGYFINPLVTVALGVLVLREQLRPLQWAAVATGALSVAVLTVDYGRPPFIALTLAATFSVYSLLKKRVGGSVGALPGLTTETITLAPFALIAILWLEATGRGSFGANAPWEGVLLVLTGIVTIAPLLLFAASTSRVPLSTVGLLQYLTPVMQLLCGVVILGEHMPASRWAGFGIVWVALVLLTLDSIRATRTPAPTVPEPA